jgi:Flp pilus assembly protein TadG
MLMRSLFCQFDSFARDRRGNVLMLTGLLITVLVSITGAGYDLAHQQLVKLRIQQASDIAALAAATMTGNPTTAQREQIAARYFALNYPETYLGVPRPTPQVEVGSSSIRVSASADMPTQFMQYVGFDTIVSGGSSTVSTDSRAQDADYDVAVVVDESGSQAAALPPYSSRMEAQKASLRTMVNAIVPAATTNQNVRVGFIGFTGYISNKWGLSNRNADALNAINQMRPIWQNFDHTGMLAAANMMRGGVSTETNRQITMASGTVAANTAVPLPRTARSSTARIDANGLSPVKYVVFISDGGIMLEPTSLNDRTGLISRYCAFSFQPCYAAFLDACTQAKNAVGTNSVHVFVINLATPVSRDQQNALTSCASETVPGGPTYTSAEKPDRTKDFLFAADSATLGRMLTNISTEIRKTKIIQ